MQNMQNMQNIPHNQSIETKDNSIEMRDETIETKADLIEHIKSWIQLDNEMRALSKEIKERRIQKKELTAALVDVMKTNEIDCFNITLKKPLNSLLTCPSKCVIVSAWLIQKYVPSAASRNHSLSITNIRRASMDSRLNARGATLLKPLPISPPIKAEKLNVSIICQK